MEMKEWRAERGKDTGRGMLLLYMKLSQLVDYEEHDEK